MNTKKIIALIIVFAAVLPAQAQQIIHNNFYVKNPFVINPAAAGLNGSLSGFVNYRDQWAGLKGAPETLHFGVHGLITGAMGLGINVQQTKQGVFKNSAADLNYSYRVGLKNSQSLAFGISFGFNQNSLNQEEMIIGAQNDNALYSSLINEALVKTGFGIHYNFKQLNIHLAAPLLYGMQEKHFLQTAFATASYDFVTEDKVWKIQPQVMYRYETGDFHQIDANLLAEWDNKIWVSGGYRTNKNIILGMGVFLKTIGLGYTYEVNRSELSSISSGSHEVLIFFESPYSLTKKAPLYKSSSRRNAWE